MIKGFEQYTQPLDDYERDVILPLLVRGLKTKIGKQQAIKNEAMISALKTRGLKKINPARIRKIINHIRVNGLIRNLVASSNGYYIELDLEERKKYAESIRQRAESMLAILNHIDI